MEKEFQKTINKAKGSLIILLIVNATFGIFLWPYTINTWLVYFGKVPQVTWYMGLVLGIVAYFNKLTIPLAVLTFIVMMFLR